MLRIAIVTNELPPYRVPFFRALARMPDVVVQVILCCLREPNRKWEKPALDFGCVFLRERITEKNGRYIHNNPDVFMALNRFAPDVVVTGGFNPTHLYAFAYTLLRGVPHVPLTDGTDVSEQALGKIHRAVRRFVFSHSKGFIAASDGGLRLFQSYGISPARCSKAPLCIDNTEFSTGLRPVEKTFDFIYCGRIEPAKNPLFALDVAMETARRIGRRVRILFAGAGEQEAELQHAASRHADLVDAQFHGFTSHSDLPALYWSARVFLFPTLRDVWGVVANEACAAGLPVIISPHAGAAHELVRDGENGFVCNLNVDLWAQRAATLLTDQATWNRFSARSAALVSDYTYENAALGVVNACRIALSSPMPGDISMSRQLSDR